MSPKQEPREDSKSPERTSISIENEAQTEDEEQSESGGQTEDDGQVVDMILFEDGRISSSPEDIARSKNKELSSSPARKTALERLLELPIPQCKTKMSLYSPF